MSNAGTALLRELAERTGPRAQFTTAVEGVRRRGGGHDPGQVLLDVAVMLADGGEAIGDIGTLAGQTDLHGPVCSPATAWRTLAGIDSIQPNLHEDLGRDAEGSPIPSAQTRSPDR